MAHGRAGGTADANQATPPASGAVAPEPERPLDASYVTRTALAVHRDDLAMHALMTRLRMHGFAAHHVANAEQAIDALDTVTPDIIVIHAARDEQSGVWIGAKVRAGTELPIVLVGDGGSEREIVRALELGVDAYITLPCGVHEVTARLGALIRRYRRGRASTPKRADAQLRDGDLVLDLDLHRLTIRRENVHVTPTQFALLELLLSQPGRTLSHDFLTSRLWGYEHFGNTRPLLTHIQRLRALVEDNPARPERILTVRSVGYRYRELELLPEVRSIGTFGLS